MSTIRERVILFLKFATGTVFFLIYIGTIDSQSASHPALDNYVIGTYIVLEF
jgi:hypothetical protein